MAARTPFNNGEDIKHVVQLSVSNDKALDGVTDTVRGLATQVNDFAVRFEKALPLFNSMVATMQRLDGRGVGMTTNHAPMGQPQTYQPAGAALTPAQMDRLFSAVERNTESVNRLIDVLKPQSSERRQATRKAAEVNAGLQTDMHADRYIRELVEAGYIDEQGRYTDRAGKSLEGKSFDRSDRRSIGEASVRYATERVGSIPEAFKGRAAEWGIENGKLDVMTMAGKASPYIAKALGKAGLSVSPEMVSSLLGTVSKFAGMAGLAYGVYQVADAGMRKYAATQQEGFVTGAQGFNAYTQGASMDLQARMMALSPFMTDEQSREIVKMTYQKGFKGKEADTVMDFAAQNFKRFGMDVASSMEIYETSVKQAGGDVEQLAGTLQTLQDVTLDSNKSLEQMTSTFKSFQKSFVENSFLGGDKGSAAALAMTGAFKNSKMSAEGQAAIARGFASPTSEGYLMAAYANGMTPTEIAFSPNAPELLMEGQAQYIQTLFPWLAQLNPRSKEDILEYLQGDGSMYQNQVMAWAQQQGLSIDDAVNYMFEVSSGQLSTDMARTRKAENKKKSAWQGGRAAAGTMATIGTSSPGLGVISGVAGGIWGTIKGIGSSAQGKGFFSGYREGYDQADFAGGWRETAAGWEKDAQLSAKGIKLTNAERAELYSEEAKRMQMPGARELGGLGLGSLGQIVVELAFKGDADKVLQGKVNTANKRDGVAKGTAQMNE